MKIHCGCNNNSLAASSKSCFSQVLWTSVKSIPPESSAISFSVKTKYGWYMKIVIQIVQITAFNLQVCWKMPASSTNKLSIFYQNSHKHNASEIDPQSDIYETGIYMKLTCRTRHLQIVTNKSIPEVLMMLCQVLYNDLDRWDVQERLGWC